jgi:magnesium transporter
MTPDPLTLHDLVQHQDLDVIDRRLADHGALDVADELVRLRPGRPSDPVPPARQESRALAVFEAFDPLHQQQLLDALGDDSVHELFNGLDASDRARLLDEMPAKVANRLLTRLPQEARANTNLLLGYPEESVGRLMSPRFVSLRASMTAADALAKVRRAGLRPREVLVLPVTDDQRRLDQRRLVGVVDLPDVVTAEPTARVSGLVRPATFAVRVDDDQELAARLMQEADLVALPVLDTEDRLVGVLTVDDAMEIIELEETEDIHRAAGAIEPLSVPYLDAGVLLLARKRAVWLLVLIAAAVLTVNVLQVFEDTLEQVVTLALFIPLLIDTGGDSGSQAATVVIRAMAVGEVRFSDLPRILRRELVVGFLLGLMLGAIALPLVTAFGWRFAVVIASTLLAICTWASFSGGVLPLLAKRLGIDPAVVSALLITTLVDATGLIIYFLLARAILGL